MEDIYDDLPEELIEGLAEEMFGEIDEKPEWWNTSDEIFDEPKWWFVRNYVYEKRGGTWCENFKEIIELFDMVKEALLLYGIHEPNGDVTPNGRIADEVRYFDMARKEIGLNLTK